MNFPAGVGQANQRARTQHLGIVRMGQQRQRDAAANLFDMNRDPENVGPVARAIPGRPQPICRIVLRRAVAVAKVQSTKRVGRTPESCEKRWSSANLLRGFETWLSAG